MGLGTQLGHDRAQLVHQQDAYPATVVRGSVSSTATRCAPAQRSQRPSASGSMRLTAQESSPQHRTAHSPADSTTGDSNSIAISCQGDESDCRSGRDPPPDQSLTPALPGLDPEAE